MIAEPGFVAEFSFAEIIYSKKPNDYKGIRPMRNYLKLSSNEDGSMSICSKILVLFHPVVALE